MSAFDANGVLPGFSSSGASATLEVAFPGAIHSVALEQGSFGFDNFAFDGLVPVPEPGTLALIVVGTIELAAGRMGVNRERLPPGAG